jgi:hypothetical protein
LAKASLTPDERRIVKALLAKGWKNQDILALINTNRRPTVNGGRITGVKTDAAQDAATDEEVAFFEVRKKAYDPRTGLNQFDDERLVRAREAMILGVQVFNSPSVSFKTEVFTVLANIAWTYLLHEHYLREDVEIVDDQGKSLVLSKMLDRGDCPLPKGIKDNLRAIKTLRDEVEHFPLGPADTRWFSLFQACCLNFDKMICEMFGKDLSLAHDLQFALQFARPEIGHLSALMNYPVPPQIAALDARLQEGMTEEDLASLEYRFRVVYTLDAPQGVPANFKFVLPETAEGQEIHNVLARRVAADDLYPHKAKSVIDLVKEQSGQAFNSSHHTKAWKLFRVRPPSKSPQPDQTDKRYCIYHKAHRDYTYSDDWIARLVEEVSDPLRFAQIKAAPG